MTDPRPFIDDYYEAMKVAARLKAAVERAEEHRKIVFSEEVIAADAPISKAEHIARASSTYADAVEELRIASVEYGDAAAKVEYLKTRFEAWRTNMATHRTKLQKGE